MSIEQDMREYLKNNSNKDDALTKKIKALIALYDKKKEGKKQDYDEVILTTCWKSLAYCCKSGEKGKPCPWRDATLELLGLTQEQFEQLKEKQKKEFRELSGNTGAKEKKGKR